jgi:hypothetical protein
MTTTLKHPLSKNVVIVVLFRATTPEIPRKITFQFQTKILILNLLQLSHKITSQKMIVSQVLLNSSEEWKGSRNGK